MAAPLIDVSDLTKILCKDLKRSLWYGTKGVARELVGLPRQHEKLRPGEFRALDRVSFSVMEGESFGLVGRNGAGKTTLLRVLSGLLTPDGGRVTVRGRVGALIALGAGFNPLLTGRENIYVNAAILGFGRAETKARFDSIVDFAEVHEFIDAPLQTYSSGMQARLGFSVAAQTEPDILLVDEVLAVGDVGFRAKCYRRINELMARGTAVILVSHQATMLHSVCAKGLLLEAGRVTAMGSIGDVVRTYEENIAAAGTDEPKAEGRARLSEELVIDEVRLLDAGGAGVEALETGAPGALNLRCTATRAFDGLNVIVFVRSFGEEGPPILALDAARDGHAFSLAPGTSDITFSMASVCLPPGRYRAKLCVARSNLDTLDGIEAFAFRVRSGKPVGTGQVFQPGRWTSKSQREPKGSKEPT